MSGGPVQKPVLQEHTKFALHRQLLSGVWQVDCLSWSPHLAFAGRLAK